MTENVFATYAAYYDLLYGDKNYSAEAAFVATQIRATVPAVERILDLGCGTGRHASAMAELGFSLVGLDRSPSMVEKAEVRRQSLPTQLASQLRFAVADVREARLGESFDAVTSLFHVMSYQLTEDDLVAVFATAAAHLRIGGCFVFDFWYGPAVLAKPPDVRIKRLAHEDLRLTRIAEPVMFTERNQVDVHYELFVEQPEGILVAHFREEHNMRYWFLPELQRLLSESGFRVARVGEWMTGTVPSRESWSVMIVAERTD